MPLKALDIDVVSSTTITVTVHYASSRIAEMEVHTFIDHFESALRFVIEHPERLIGDVELINNREMQLLIGSETLTDWETDINGEDGPYCLGSCSSSVHNVSELIQLQVERTPQKIAVSAFNWCMQHSDSFAAPIWSRCVLNLWRDGLSVKLSSPKTYLL